MRTRWIVYTRNPEKPSFRIRFRMLAPLLAARGVTLETVEFPRRRRERAAVLARAASFDGAIVAKFLMGGSDLRALRRAARALVYDVDDAVCYPDDGHTGFLTHLSKRMRRFRAVCASADAVHAATPVLADLARAAHARRIALVPSGAVIRPLAPPPVTRRLGWVGSRSTRKYLAMLDGPFRTLAAQAEPPTLVILADEPVSAPLPVEFHAWSEAAEAAVLPTVSLGLAPLPDNAFTRGKAGYKIISLAAYGIASAASPVGGQTALIEPGISGFFCRTPDEWIAAASAPAAQLAAFGRAARERIMATHALDRAADAAAASLAALVAAGAPA